MQVNWKVSITKTTGDNFLRLRHLEGNMPRLMKHST